MTNVNFRSLPIIIKRSLISLGVILLIRIGSFFPIPGINNNDLALYTEANSLASAFINPFSVDSTSIIGLFTLNIFPYINASILIQLIISFSPSLSRLQKEGDLNARRSLSRLTRFITLILAIFQSVSLGLYLRKILFDWNIQLLFEIVLWLTTGAMIVLWLSELVNDYGLGNGASLLIYSNIIANFPNLYNQFKIRNTESFNSFSVSIIVLLTLASVYGIFFLQDGVRCIPLLSSKQLNQFSKKESRLMASYIPLRLNQAGIMPIILTTTVLVIPTYNNNLATVSGSEIILPDFPLLYRAVYWVTYFGLILLFSSLYSTIVLNPKDISDQLQKMAVIIPGIRPGVQTTFYLKKLMRRLTILGSFMLATLATLPNLIQGLFNISSLNGLGTTSFLIMGGVIVELVKQIEDITFSTIYANK